MFQELLDLLVARITEQVMIKLKEQPVTSPLSKEALLELLKEHDVRESLVTTITQSTDFIDAINENIDPNDILAAMDREGSISSAVSDVLENGTFDVSFRS